MAYELLNTDTGKPERVDDAGMQSALESGRYQIRADALVPMDDGTGKIRMVNGAEVAQATNAGYKYAPQSQVKAYDERKAYDSAAGAAAALTAATASGATLGASDWLLSQTPLKDDIAKSYEYNPTAKLIGEATGFAGSMLLPGAQAGAVVKGGKLAKALTAAPKLTNVAAQGAEKMVLAAAQKAAIPGLSKALQSKVMQGALSTAARGAVEGAVYDAGRILSESSIEDKEFTAEQIVSRLGASAAIGGAGGAVMNTLGLGVMGAGKVGLRGAKAAADAVAETIASKTGKDVAGWVKNQAKEGFIRGSAFLKRTEPEKIKTAIENAPKLQNRDKLIDEAVAETRKNIEFTDEARSIIEKEAKGELKLKHIQEQLSKTPEGMPPRDEQLAYNATLDTVTSVLQRTEDMLSKEGLQAFGHVNEVRRLRDAAKEALKMASTGKGIEAEARMYRAVDKLKRQTQTLARKRVEGPDSKDTSAAAAGREIYESLRLHLEDPKLWGAMGESQKNINRPWSEYIGLREGNLRKFMIDVDSNNWEAVRRADPKKIKSYYERSHLGEEVSLEHELMDKSIENNQAFIRAVRDNYDISPDVAALVGKIEAANKRLLEMREKVRGEITDMNIAQEVMGMTSPFGALGAGGVGAAVLGPAGAAIGAVAGAMQRPVQTVQQVGTIMGIAKSGKDLAAKAVKGFVKKAQEPATKAAAATATQARRVSGIAAISAIGYEPGRKKYESRAEAYQARLDELSKLATDPAQMAARIESVTKGFAANAPEVAAQTGATMRRAVAFLYDKAPKPAGGIDPLRPNKKWRPSDMELAKFARYQAAVEYPQSVVDGLARGDVSREGVEALREVYPATYHQVKKQIVENLADIRGDLNYQARRQLSVMFGVPVEATMRPDFIATMQSTLAQPLPEQQSKKQGRPIALQSKASDTLTQAQRIARGVGT